jgi:predicted nucleic acid-binding protein
MILVDTSVLISFLRGEENSEVNKLIEIIDRGISFGINYFIYQELLQGVSSEDQFNKLKDYLDSLKFFELKRGKDSFADASKIYFNCKKNGITIRSTIDCLIVQTAIENNLLLLHNDRDFTMISKIYKNLSFL